MGTVTVEVHAETVGRVGVSTISDNAVSVTIGDDLRGVRLLGSLIDVHQLVVEADPQLTGFEIVVDEMPCP